MKKKRVLLLQCFSAKVLSGNFVIQISSSSAGYEEVGVYPQLPHECMGLDWSCALHFSFNWTQRLLSNVHVLAESMVVERI